MHGVCKFWALDGRLLGAFEIVEGTGTFRTWDHDGRLRTEVSTVRRTPTGRLRQWDEAGELTEAFMDRLQALRKRYDALAALDSGMPR